MLSAWLGVAAQAPRPLTLPCTAGTDTERSSPLALGPPAEEVALLSGLDPAGLRFALGSGPARVLRAHSSAIWEASSQRRRAFSISRDSPAAAA